jgi:hypothetical protein
MNPWELPVVVLTLVTWLNAPSPSLGDLARKEALRRQMVPKATHTLVTSDLPPGEIGPISIPVSTSSPDTPPAGAGQPPAAGADADKSKDEKFWRDRMSQARQALDRDRMLVEAMQGRINSLTTDFVNRDDPAQRAVVEQNRQKALAELDRLRKQVVADQDAIAEIQKDAHRQGVPAGWIR